MKKGSKLIALVLVVALIASLALVFTACGDKKTEEVQKVVRISSTSSVKESGLMAYLLPYFTADTGYTWELSAKQTGAAIEAAKLGNADVILVHSKDQEEKFVNAKTGEVSNNFARKVDGYTSERITFMYNYFVIVGPSATNATTANVQTTDAKAEDAMKKIFDAAEAGNAKFISRGDSSGTRSKESKLWDAVINNKGADATKFTTEPINGTNYTMPSNTSWFEQCNDTMGATLTIANQKSAYCLTDKATFLNYKANGNADNLEILYEQASDMMNKYTMIAVNKDAKFINADGEIVENSGVKIDEVAANIFINWMNSVRARYLIENYSINNQKLFTLYDLSLSLTEMPQ